MIQGNMKFIFYIFILIFNISSPVFGKDICNIKLDKYTVSEIGVTNICDWAHKISDEIQMTLPKNLTISLRAENATSQKNTIKVLSRVNYDDAYWAKISAENNTTPEKTQSTLSITLQEDICHSDNHVYNFRDFIRAGGSVVYEYIFIDSKPFVSATVNDCDSLH